MNEGNVNELRLRFEREYLPIRLGNWSKVTDECTKNSCNPDIGCRYIDDDQTTPKSNPTEEGISNVIKKLDEYFRSKKTPAQPLSDEQHDPLSLEYTPPAQSPDSAIYMSITSPLDLSESLVDLNDPEDSKCTLSATKVYVEFESRQFHCEGCGSSFCSIDDAAEHLLKDVNTKSPDHSKDQCIIIEGIVKKEQVVVSEKMQMAGYEMSEGTKEEEENIDLSNQDERPAEEHAEDGSNDVFNGGEKEFTYDEYATLQKKDFDDIDKASRTNSSSDLLKFILEDEMKNERKKKKSKTWKFIKGTFMLVIRILF